MAENMAEEDMDDFTRENGELIVTVVKCQDLFDCDQKYSGYFADNFDNFTSTESDAKFDSVFFTSINTTTPGTNFDDTYSVQWRGFFLSRTAGS